MKRIHLFPALTFLFLSFNHCSNPDTAAHMEGLWITTEESSHLFAPGADHVALLISRDSSHMPSARGFFLKNGEFKFEWGSNLQFNGGVFADDNYHKN